MLNAYKKTMKEVPNAISGRDNPDVVVNGMDGLPKGVLEERSQKLQADREEREEKLAKLKEDQAARKREQEAKSKGSQAAAKKTTGVEASKELEKNDSSTGEASEPATTAPEPSSMPAKALAPLAPEKGKVLNVDFNSKSQPDPDLPPPPPPPEEESTELTSAMELLVGQPELKLSSDVEVPGIPGKLVTKSLAGLHTVALQALAIAGLLDDSNQVDSCSAIFNDVLNACKISVQQQSQTPTAQNLSANEQRLQDPNQQTVLTQQTPQQSALQSAIQSSLQLPQMIGQQPIIVTLAPVQSLNVQSQQLQGQASTAQMLLQQVQQQSLPTLQPLQIIVQGQQPMMQQQQMVIMQQPMQMHQMSTQQQQPALPAQIQRPGFLFDASNNIRIGSGCSPMPGMHAMMGARPQMALGMAVGPVGMPRPQQQSMPGFCGAPCSAGCGGCCGLQALQAQMQNFPRAVAEPADKRQRIS